MDNEKVDKEEFTEDQKSAIQYIEWMGLSADPANVRAVELVHELLSLLAH